MTTYMDESGLFSVDLHPSLTNENAPTNPYIETAEVIINVRLFGNDCRRLINSRTF